MSPPSRRPVDVTHLRHPDPHRTTYLVTDPAAGAAVVIDPCKDALPHLSAAERAGVRIRHAFVTRLDRETLAVLLDLKERFDTHLYSCARRAMPLDPTSPMGGCSVRFGRIRLRISHDPATIRVFDAEADADRPRLVVGAPRASLRGPRPRAAREGCGTPGGGILLHSDRRGYTPSP